MKNVEKRKRIMQRSIKLGHCICNPKQPCPCDLLKQQDICLCAGERIENKQPAKRVKLMQLVTNPGCASKIDQGFLKKVLRNLPVFDDPRILVGFPAGDDAGVYDIGNGQALVQTVDVFTPSVDDPYTFGQIAAANSLSDIYAMGGVPLTALSVLGFPARLLADSVLHEILKGGCDTMKRASVAVIGGHSINDPEIKAGFAVTGLIDKNKIITNSGLRPGDILILTKPVGTGIVAFASQIRRANSKITQHAVKSMTQLNKKAAELMVRFNAHACTDITGFGLLGHLTEMARQSKIDVEIIWDDIPLLPGVLQLAADSILPGAIERNKESCADRVTIAGSLPGQMVDICYDAQTSGGLLIAVAPKDAAGFLKALHKSGVSAASVIGKAIRKSSGRVFIRSTGMRAVPSPGRFHVRRR
jgi:selenide,water dikinase